MFANREEAAKLLVQKLQGYKNSNSIVIALPRGGVPIGAIIAKELKLPFDIFFVKKIPSPYNREAGIGAVSENGYYFVNEAIKNSLGIDNYYIQNQINEIMQKIKEKRALYQKKRVPIKNKDVIIVDDGIATGSSMFLAARALKEEGAKNVIIAAPLAPLDVVMQLKQIAKEVVVLEILQNFMAVGAHYIDFHQLSDKEVMQILKEVQR